MHRCFWNRVGWAGNYNLDQQPDVFVKIGIYKDCFAPVSIFCFAIFCFPREPKWKWYNGRTCDKNGRSMSLNIKNQEAHKLARELAKLTGESMATAVTIALKERLQRLRKRSLGSREQRLAQIREDSGRRLLNNCIDHGAMLYGEDGLPK